MTTRLSLSVVASRRARFRFARPDHCSSTTSTRLNFRVARHSRTLANPANKIHLQFSVAPADNDFESRGFSTHSTAIASVAHKRGYDTNRQGQEVLGTSPS